MARKKNTPTLKSMICAPLFQGKHEKVTIEAYDRHGKPFTLDAEGFMARAICHENDHLDGHIFKDITHHMLTDEELRELDEE